MKMKSSKFVTLATAFVLLAFAEQLSAGPVGIPNNGENSKTVQSVGGKMKKNGEAAKKGAGDTVLASAGESRIVTNISSVSIAAETVGKTWRSNTSVSGQSIGEPSTTQLESASLTEVGNDDPLFSLTEGVGSTNCTDEANEFGIDSSASAEQSSITGGIKKGIKGISEGIFGNISGGSSEHESESSSIPTIGTSMTGISGEGSSGVGNGGQSFSLTEGVGITNCTDEPNESGIDSSASAEQPSITGGIKNGMKGISEGIFGNISGGSSEHESESSSIPTIGTSVTDNFGEESSGVGKGGLSFSLTEGVGSTNCTDEANESGIDSSASAEQSSITGGIKKGIEEISEGIFGNISGGSSEHESESSSIPTVGISVTGISGEGSSGVGNGGQSFSLTEGIGSTNCTDEGNESGIHSSASAERSSITGGIKKKIDGISEGVFESISEGSSEHDFESSSISNVGTSKIDISGEESSGVGNGDLKFPLTEGVGSTNCTDEANEFGIDSSASAEQSSITGGIKNGIKEISEAIFGNISGGSSEHEPESYSIPTVGTSMTGISGEGSSGVGNGGQSFSLTEGVGSTNYTYEANESWIDSSASAEQTGSSITSAIKKGINGISEGIFGNTSEGSSEYELESSSIPTIRTSMPGISGEESSGFGNGGLSFSLTEGVGSTNCTDEANESGIDSSASAEQSSITGGIKKGIKGISEGIFGNISGGSSEHESESSSIPTIGTLMTDNFGEESSGVGKGGLSFSLTEGVGSTNCTDEANESGIDSSASAEQSSITGGIKKGIKEISEGIFGNISGGSSEHESESSSIPTVGTSVTGISGEGSSGVGNGGQSFSLTEGVEITNCTDEPNESGIDSSASAEQPSITGGIKNGIKGISEGIFGNMSGESSEHE